MGLLVQGSLWSLAEEGSLSRLIQADPLLEISIDGRHKLKIVKVNPYLEVVP